MTLFDRRCTVCSIPMREGYHCCDESYCSRECLDTSFEGTGETWEEHYTDDGECYWTEWEEVVVGGAHVEA